MRPVRTQYPQTILSANPYQYIIKMLLDDGTEVEATVTGDATQIDVGAYARWIGPMTGTVGGVSYEGSAVWEQFKLKL